MTDTRTSRTNIESFVMVGRTGDFAEGSGKRVIVNGRGVAVFRVAGRFFALRDRCTHGAARLSGGSVKGACVACPRHGAHFDLETGVPTTLQAVVNVETFAVRVENGSVFVSTEGTFAEPAWFSGRRLDQWSSQGEEHDALSRE